MNLRMCSAIALAIGTLAATAPPVHALPGDQEILFSIFEDPEDPQSDLVLTVYLALHAVDSSPTAVAWDVTKVVITEPDEGSGETSWADLSPDVDTADGLWWIKHKDLESPEIHEFVLPPLVEGTAVEQGTGNPDDADYAIEGTGYAPPAPPAEPPYGTTAAINDLFWIVGESQPVVDILDQPVCIIHPEEEEETCDEGP